MISREGFHHLPATCLRDTILACLQHTKGALIPHLEQTLQGQLQNHVLFEGHKVADIFQQEEAWPIIVTVAEVTDNQRVLELRVFPGVESVHTTEALAGRSTTQHVHLSLTWKLLPTIVSFLSLLLITVFPGRDRERN